MYDKSTTTDDITVNDVDDTTVINIDLEKIRKRLEVKKLFVLKVNFFFNFQYFRKFHPYDFKQKCGRS